MQVTEMHILSFNPRSHEGSDEKILCCYIKFMQCFNPRSHEGSDCIDMTYNSINRSFNPRSHEGSDYPRRRNSLLLESFNPRSHEGSDSNFAQKSSVFSVEINNFFFPIN